MPESYSADYDFMERGPETYVNKKAVDEVVKSIANGEGRYQIIDARAANRFLG